MADPDLKITGKGGGGGGGGHPDPEISGEAGLQKNFEKLFLGPSAPV